MQPNQPRGVYLGMSIKRSSALPAAIFSGVMFLVSFGLYLFVDRVDADVRHSAADRQQFKCGG